MSDDVECPYCGKWVEICHDDGYGYDENETFIQECSHCDKTFTYTTAISFHYDAQKAPCQNGESHNLKPMKGIPQELFVGKMRCEYCQKIILIDEDAHRKSIKEYFEKLKGNN